ncbi:unnamed protein product [Arabidopsis halleri]
MPFKCRENTVFFSKRRKNSSLCPHCTAPQFFENVGPTCCKAFTEVDAKCWPKMFPLNPLFPPLLKDGCSRIISGAPAHTTPQFPLIPGSPIDLTKCLSSLVNVQDCVTEIHKTVFTGNVLVSTQPLLHTSERKKRGPVRPPCDHPGKVEPSRVTILYSSGCVQRQS